MADTRQIIVDAARECIGTPWHHQGRVVGAGLDCLGLLVHCSVAAGKEVRDETNYKRVADESRLIEALISHDAKKVDRESIQTADILFFKMAGRMQHAGVVVSVDPIRFVHAYNVGPSVVAEVELSNYWTDKLHSVWRLR